MSARSTSTAFGSVYTREVVHLADGHELQVVLDLVRNLVEVRLVALGDEHTLDA
nr:hypothetical protein [Labilithrix luteola]